MNAGHLKHPLNAMNNGGTQNGKVHIVNVYKIGGVDGGGVVDFCIFTGKMPIVIDSFTQCYLF